MSFGGRFAIAGGVFVNTSSIKDVDIYIQIEETQIKKYNNSSSMHRIRVAGVLLGVLAFLVVGSRAGEPHDTLQLHLSMTVLRLAYKSTYCRQP